MSPVFSFSACSVETGGGWLAESTVISSAFVTLVLDPFRSIDVDEVRIQNFKREKTCH